MGGVVGEDRRNDIDVTEGEELVRTTIVGGQPRQVPKVRVSIRVGLERVLYRAAVDARFREALLAERGKALDAAGLVLSDNEAAILGVVSREALESMIRNVRPHVSRERRFMKAVAATFVTLATGTAGCEGGTAELDAYNNLTLGDSGLVDHETTMYPDAGISPEADDQDTVDLDLPQYQEVAGESGVIDSEAPEVQHDVMNELTAGDTAWMDQETQAIIDAKETAAVDTDVPGEAAE